MAKRIAKPKSQRGEERPPGEGSKRLSGDGSLQICALGPFRVLVDGRLVTERQLSPALDMLREEPRFAELVRLVGLRGKEA